MRTIIVHSVYTYIQDIAVDHRLKCLDEASLPISIRVLECK